MEDTPKEYLLSMAATARRYWTGATVGAMILGGGVAIEATNYRPERYGLILIGGGVISVIGSTIPVKKWDNANDLLKTYREIKSLPEATDFTEKR